MRYSDQLRRPQDTRNRLPPLSPFRTRIPLRRQGSPKHPARAAEPSKHRPVLCPEAESWASQYMRRRPASIPRENIPLQSSEQAADSDLELGQDIPDICDSAWYSAYETTVRAETSSLAHNEVGRSHLQSNVDVQDPGSPLSPFAGKYTPGVANFPADNNYQRSPSPERKILAPSPFETAVDVEEICLPSFSVLGEDTPTRLQSFSDIDISEPYFPSSPDFATASLSFLPDWEPEQSYQQESNEITARHHDLVAVDSPPWHQPLALSRAADRTELSHIVSHYAQPGLAHDSTSLKAMEDIPQHESDHFPIRDHDNIIDQHSRPTAAQMNRFQCSSSMGHQVQYSAPFGEDSPFLYNVEVASTPIPSSEERSHLIEQDEISDEESEGTVVGDGVEIDGVWTRVERPGTDSMI